MTRFRIGLVVMAALVLSSLSLVGAQEPGDLPRVGVVRAPEGGGGSTMGSGLRSVLDQAVLESGAAVGTISDFRREEIVPGIAHYAFKVRVGDGPYDVVGIHRVIREECPWVPARTREGLFLMHGAMLAFEPAYLGNARIPGNDPRHTAPVYMAERGLDVWGIDMGWTFIPADATDFSSLNGWGAVKDASHVRIALAIARAGRRLTGSSGGQMFLSGWSWGGAVGYVVVSEESQMPRAQRHVKAYIPVDGGTEMPERWMGEFCCPFLPYWEDQIAAGIYQDTSGTFFQTLGYLAETDPAGPSPFMPDLTNVQFALLYGGATWIFGDIEPAHLVAAYLDETGFPVDLRWITAAYWFDWLQLASPYQSNNLMLDYNRMFCTDGPSGPNEHLSDVTIPILYVCPVGGNGVNTSGDLLYVRSRDASILKIQLLPPEQKAEDYAHVDVWNAYNADTVVWEPMLNWIRAH